jgi:choline dehydrogenase-like flavoprotein
MKRAIVVGSGAGGATVARELQGRFEVTILEAGHEFQPFLWPLPRLERLRQSGLLFDERLIRLFFPPMRTRRTNEGMVLVNGIGVGGTTTLATGNALRMDADLKAIGLDLDAEFGEISREIPISCAHQARWRETTRQLYAICQGRGLETKPTPKMGEVERCAHCGRCVLGCPSGVKWDSRRFVQQALERGAQLITGCVVERVVIRDRKAVGVEARQGWSRRFYPADLVVLAAGGLATPVILERSGITCEPRLFVDPVLCVAAEAAGCRQCFELEMPFVVQREGFIVSPYFDLLSYFFTPAWRRYPAGDVVAIMIKLADANQGRVLPGRLEKTLGPEDHRRLNEGLKIGTEILRQFGAREEGVFLGTLNAGHPGGMLPLTEQSAQTLHDERLPENLYVADASLLPRSLGNPPILTIIAMAKRVGSVIAQQLA